MEGFGAATFGELNAADYDALHDPGTTQQTVDLIAGLARPNDKLLELAIGSGRIALPLYAKGFDISGIEASQDMVELLRGKPSGLDIPVSIGDMADCQIDGTFDFAFLVFNTLFNLTSQEAQVRCFSNVGAKLNKGGKFLIETFVPDLSEFEGNQVLRTKKLDMNQVWIEAITHDPVRQLLEMQRIRITQEGMKLVPLPMRYAYPAEIDLIAKLAGLELVERWGDWQKGPFTAQSQMHISFYEKR